MLMKLSSSFFFPFAILNYQACGLFIDSTADRLHSPHIPFLITPNPKTLTYSPFPECDVYIQAFNSAMTQINCAYLNSNPQLLTFLTYVLSDSRTLGTLFYFTCQISVSLCYEFSF